jgi:hypothetical protein
MDTVPVARLERDWRRQLASRALMDHLRDWRSTEPALRPFADPRALLRYLRRSTPGERQDAVLLALLARARSDPLAARFVLQAMLPALKRLSARVPLGAGEQAELWSTLLACAWERIRSYPIERRPRRVAANLRLDTLHDVVCAHRVAVAERALIKPHALHRLPPPPRTGGDVDALLARAVRAGAISKEEAELIASTRLDGLPLEQAAAARRISRHAVVVRRLRAEQRLFLHLGFGRVTHRRSKRLLEGARVAGAGPSGLAGAEENAKP